MSPPAPSAQPYFNMDFAEQLKSSLDIVKVVGEYVRLRRSGSTGRYTGLCPFHQEKTPSFGVHQGRQFYKCFGCSAGGDVFKFVMEIEGLTFPEVLKLLAERNGIPIPQRTEFTTAESKLRAVLLDMHTLAAARFQEALRGPQGAEPRAYLARRGVSQEIVDAFELGYSDPSGQTLARIFAERGFSAEQMETSGLVRKRDTGGYYDSFRGRLMFPIHNESGKVIAFGGRALRDEDQPKYLNSPETPIYRKTSVLYNLHRARESMRRANRAVLVEGYMDVIGVYVAGVKEVVASCGTALTAPQVRAIRRHADTVAVNFDPDAAGANAAERAIQPLLDEGLNVRIVSLDAPGSSPEVGPGVKLDPDEFAKRFGAEAYRAALDTAAGYFHWLADRARARYDMRSAEGRVAAFKFLLPAVQKISDKLERAAVADDVASYLGLDKGLVLDQFKKAATDRTGASAFAPPASAAAASGVPRVSIPAMERILLNALLSGEEARAEILPQLPPSVTEEFSTREVFEALRQADLNYRETGSPVTLAHVDARLAAPAQTLLHAALNADETEGDELREQARACVRRLQSDTRKRHLDNLRSLVKSAEREGRLEEALNLMAELGRLERETPRGPTSAGRVSAGAH
ncbi:MAG TPA: DNA primase [Bryobacteraceae bacterium]|nr:DNA primase [Bryobacteraceae bacterium]